MHRGTRRGPWAGSSARAFVGLLLIPIWGCDDDDRSAQRATGAGGSTANGGAAGSSGGSAGSSGGTSSGGSAGSSGGTSSGGSTGTTGGESSDGASSGGTGANAETGGANSGDASTGGADAGVEGGSDASDGGDSGPGGVPCQRADYSPSCEPWTDVATHTDHACGLSGGALYCWGSNASGQLGVGDQIDRSTPVRVGSGQGWTAIVTGGAHTCGIRDGGLYCWGSGYPRGIEGGTVALVPERVGAESDWKRVTGGDVSTCAVRGATNKLYCWGSNWDGTTGTGMDPNVPVPTEVPLEDCTSVSVAFGTAAAVCGGKLYGWGDSGGVVGDDAFEDRFAPVQLGTASDWATVARGERSACAVKTDGALWCWGPRTERVPTVKPARSDWKTVAAGAQHACGISQVGDAYCWGRNDLGQLGDGTTADADAPKLLRGGCTHLVTAKNVTFGIFDGGLYSWGPNEKGVRGVRGAPRRVESASDWTAVDPGYGYTCGIRNGGELYCWGSVPSLSPSAPVASPTRVGADTGWTHVDVGWSHACGIQSGKLFCWGRNADGALGDDSTEDRPAPVRVGTATDWVDVRASNDLYPHSCGIRSGGALYCWGSNGSGQLGDGTNEQRSVPSLVSSPGWSALSLGDSFTCGVRSGALYCWGNAMIYRLGNGAEVEQKTPLRIGTSSTWSAVGASFGHGCGVDGGSVYCWGANFDGESGNAAGMEPFPRPALVASTSGAASVAVAGSATCAVSSGGTLRCWGSNMNGLLGTGAGFFSPQAPAVVEGDGWNVVAAGSHSFCGIRQGALYCWGSNDRGMLGKEGLVPGAVESRPGD